jgi:hypothetical protein
MRLFPQSPPRLLLAALVAACASLSAPASAQAPAKAPKEPAAAAFEKCRSSNLAKERDCYAATLDARLEEGGPALALKLLDDLAARDADVRRDGHFYAHRIGISALKTPADVGRVFASCTPAYQSGCYHGVIQSYFMAEQSAGRGVTTESADALCSDYRGTRADLLFQCTHGLGHGLAILHKQELPDALASCDLLSRGDEREMCYAGAFMETVVNAMDPHAAPPPAKSQPAKKAAAAVDHSAHGAHAHHAAAAAEAAPAKPPFKALDPSNLHHPCSAVAEKYLIACYTIQTSVMLHHTKRDVGRTAAECAKAPEKARATCFLSLGRDVSSIALGNNAEAVRLCGLSEAAFRPACHRGVVESVVNMNASPAEGIPYCRAVTEPDSKRACYTAVGLQALVLPEGDAKREQACRLAETDYAEACLGRPVSTAAASGAV